MKTSRNTLAKSILVAILLMGLSSPALAKTKVHFGIGREHTRLNRGDRDGHRLNRQRPRQKQNRRHRSARREISTLGRRWRLGRWPNFYVFAAPRIIQRTPVIVEEKTVVVSTSSPQVVQPAEAEYDEETLALFETLRGKKERLLNQLQTEDKEKRKDSIKELAAFSFDDTVRQVLENVLLLDPDAELRKEVIKAFEKVKNTNALAALEKARVEDSDKSVRKEADEAIKKIRGY